jgi:VPDSG-CTERM motif
MLSAIAIASLGLSGMVAQAIETSISGTVSFSGTATTDSANLATATQFTSFQDVFVGAPSALLGDYAGTSGAAVTMKPFTFNPAGASTPVTPLWTFVSGGKTYSFDLSVVHEDFASPTGILLSGMGTAHITGELDTTGQWDFSGQTLGVDTFTFSSTTQVPTPTTSVPDGGSTALLLGASFCGIALLQRKMVKA